MAESIQQEALEQFKLVTGVNPGEEEEEQEDVKLKISRLLTIHDYDVNNAVSTYFDTGFESVENPAFTPTAEESSASTSALDTSGFLDAIPDEEMTHRSSSSSSARREMINLQNQMIMNSLIPRLPKAPQISMRWQLDVGIYSSLIHDREEKLKKEKKEQQEDDKDKDKDNDDDLNEKTRQVYNEKKEKKPQPKPRSASSMIHTLWFILMLIPKNFLSMLITSINFLFGFGWSDDDGSSFQKSGLSFNFDNFHPNYKFLNKISKPTVEKYSLAESEFNNVLKSCQTDYHWLFVILTNDSSEGANFVESLLHNETFQSLFSKSKGSSSYDTTKIFVGNVDRCPEAFEVAKTYKVKKLPYVMLVANVSPAHDIMPSMSIVYKSNLSRQFITGDELEITIPKIVKHLSRNCEKFNPQLVSARYDKQEMDFSRMIRQQQDDAYEESLVKDRVKKKQREDELKSQREAASLVNIKRWLLLDLFKSGFLDKSTKDGEEKRMRVAVKLPSGKRIVDQFNKNLTIVDFYVFIELKLFVEELVTEVGSETKLTEQVDSLMEELEIMEHVREKFTTVYEYFAEYDFKFDIVQPYPKKLIKADDSVVIGDAPDFKGANFLVEYKMEDDESEEEE
ncbi:uncharacterized protein LODBEIA_P39340 [Lodderomyces beijingensis]|uniref:UBX domain-containing protein n=1 Tax=Lodderomyces beijingensis TaxID=1775926 RepID=A0ABP0ZR99_9ASCO